MLAQAPLDVYRGDTGHWTFTFWTDKAATVPFDLTGVVAKAEVRVRPDTEVLVALICKVILPNTVDVVLDAVDSALLHGGSARWDLQATFPDHTVRTLVAGSVTITADITDSGMLTL